MNTLYATFFNGQVIRRRTNREYHAAWVRLAKRTAGDPELIVDRGWSTSAQQARRNAARSLATGYWDRASPEDRPGTFRRYASVRILITTDITVRVPSPRRRAPGQ